MEEAAYLVAGSNFAKFGARHLLKLKRAFSVWSEVWNAPLLALRQAGIEENLAAEFISFRSQFDVARAWERLQEENISLVEYGDADFPPLLNEIYDPPILLYVKGRWEKDLDRFPLAVVGSRHPSPYGKQVAQELTLELARQGLTIVSGLALGIDALAHTAALAAGGRTIAVLGSGLDWEHIYPTPNRQLAEKIIAAGGAVISEFPLDTLPLRHHFPIRNRIISGLSWGTLVVEAAEDSGSLLTARSALEQNREVFSIPGSIYSPLAYGPNNLLKMGAKVVTGPTDILDALRLESAAPLLAKPVPQAANAEEAALLKVLSKEPQHIDFLTKHSELPAPLAASTLTLMEMKGVVKNLGGMLYILNR